MRFGCGFVTAVLFGAERRSTQREKDIRHEKTHISVRLGSSFCFVRVCDLIIRWWFALILVAIGTAVIPAYEKWVANYYHQETVVITPKKRLAYLLLGLAGIVAGFVLHFVIPEGNDFLLYD